MARNNRKDLSRHISRKLDIVGYNRESIWERIEYMNKSSKAKELSTKKLLGDESIQKIIVGSQRDGTGLGNESDLDILQIYNSVICIEDISQKTEYCDRTVLYLDKSSAPAGYTFLTVTDHDKSSYHRSIAHTIRKKNSQDYVSSDLFMSRNDDIFFNNNGHIGSRTRYFERKGPSIPKTVKTSLLEQVLFNRDNSKLRMDFVRALPCKCDSLVSRWCERSRQHKWPSQKDIEHIRYLPTYVVPVGKKGSKNEDLQWRISFIMAEIYLIKSFNNIQTKILVLLKLITKHLFQPICNEISSYIIKNVMFWICETYSRNKFRQKHLLIRLADALNLLKTSVQNQELKCYMIPEKNLLGGKLNAAKREELVLKIDQVLSQGQELLYNYFRRTLTSMEKYDSALVQTFFGHMRFKIVLNNAKDSTAEEEAEFYVSMFNVTNQFEWVFQEGIKVLPIMYRYGHTLYYTEGHICSKHHKLPRYLKTEKTSGIHTENVNALQDTQTTSVNSDKLSNETSLCLHDHLIQKVSFLLVFLSFLLITTYLYRAKGMVAFIIRLAISLTSLSLLLIQVLFTKHVKSESKYDMYYPCVPLGLYNLWLIFLILLLILLLAMLVDSSTYILRYPIIFRDITKWTFDYLEPVSGIYMEQVMGLSTGAIFI